MSEKWKVSGNIMLKHNDDTIGNTFPDIVPLKGVKVKVSAREKLLGVWGPLTVGMKLPPMPTVSLKLKKIKIKATGSLRSRFCLKTTR